MRAFEPDRTYHAYVRRVVDGDTVVLDIDLGLRCWLFDVHCRLYGINAPELHAADPVPGQTALAALQDLVRRYALPTAADRRQDPRLLIKTHKKGAQPDADDKYGRWLVELLGTNEAGEAVHLNDEMVRRGFAETYMRD